MGLFKTSFIFTFILFIYGCIENSDNEKVSTENNTANCFSYFTIKDNYNLCFPTENMFCNTKNSFQDESLICKNKFKKFITQKIDNNKNYIHQKANNITENYNLSEKGKQNVKNSIFNKIEEHYKDLNDFEHSLLQLQILFEQYNVNCHTDKNIHRCGNSKNSINKFYVDYINKTHFLDKNADLILKDTKSILDQK